MTCFSLQPTPLSKLTALLFPLLASPFPASTLLQSVTDVWGGVLPQEDSGLSSISQGSAPLTRNYFVSYHSVFSGGTLFVYPTPKRTEAILVWFCFCLYTYHVSGTQVLNKGLLTRAEKKANESRGNKACPPPGQL